MPERLSLRSALNLKLIWLSLFLHCAASGDRTRSALTVPGSNSGSDSLWETIFVKVQMFKGDLKTRRQIILGF